MKYGYARVSSEDQKAEMQHAAFKKAGVERANIFTDKLPGDTINRPALRRCLKKLDAGDVTFRDKWRAFFNGIRHRSPCKIGCSLFLWFETRAKRGFRQHWTACKVGCTLLCMSTGVYIRVSSPKGQKTDSQRAELEAWLKRHRHNKGVQWFEDRDSATNLQREAFQQLQAAIFAGKVTTVVVWKLDRLARNLKEGVNVLADWCKRGVRLIAITQQIDLSGPVGHLIASLLFGIAEIELQHSKERQAIGIALAKKRGVYAGRKSGTTKAAPSRARALKKQGLKVSEIAAALGVKQRSVYNYLSRRAAK